MLNVLAEGDYGFAMPSNIEFYIVMAEGGHDDHDDHSGHDDHDDHGDEHGDDDHDDHWTLERGMEDCDSDNDSMVTYTELLVCVQTDLDNDGHDDVEAATVLEDGVLFNSNDMNNDTFLSSSELSKLNSMLRSGDHGIENDHGDEGEHSDEEEGDGLSFDPHSWLDPVAFKEQVKLVLATLVAKYPSMDSKFTDNAEEFMATLDSLDEKFASTFVTGTSCSSNKVAANHNAYSYMSQRYGLEFVTIHGLDPEGEPTAADIIKVVDQINENGITVFFIEEYTSTEAVQSIVEQTISDTMPTGVTVKYLYTMEMAPKDSTDNYASLMEKNFENLQSGLGCTA
jgi:zinc transport system substrate-binding protein